MARITKWDLKKQIFDLHDKAVKLHDELMPLMESDKITAGSYYYLLSPTNEYAFKKFWKKQCKSKRVTIWELNQTIKQVTLFIKCQELTLELGYHDLDKCNDIQFERV